MNHLEIATRLPHALLLISVIAFNSSCASVPPIAPPAKPPVGEFLDSRVISDMKGTRTLHASVDSDTSQLLLYSIDEQTRQVVPEFRSAPLNFPVEGLCLYQDPQQRLHLFLLSELFQAHQYLLLPDALPSAQQGWRMIALRTLPLGPETEFCAIDDGSGTFFASEAGLAIWAHDAHPEADSVRALVDVAAPWGELGNGPGAIQARNGELLIADGDNQHLLSLPIEGALFQHISASVLPEVIPASETDSMPDQGDAADDPAVWLHPENPDQSLILGTNKRRGLFVYDLVGRELQRLDVGRINNVDVRYGVSWQGREVDLAAASNRDLNTISLFAIDRSTRQLTLVSNVQTPLTEIYGLCLFQSASGQIHAFVNDEGGTYLQYGLQFDADHWSGALLREFSVGSQPEGCVANDRTAELFVGEEDVGIWRIGAEADSGTELQSVARVDGDLLHDDIEGLAIYSVVTETSVRDLLVVSSQGNNSYVVLEAVPPYTSLGAFRVGMTLDSMIDGTSETDGLEVSSANLGGVYSAGILVVQDGRNVLPAEPQNFKVVPWSAIQDLLEKLPEL